MLELKKANLSTDLDPRTWHPIAYEGRPTAYIVDTNGHPLGLWKHQIAEDGSVSPSVGCQICNFHDFVKLLGWPGSRASSESP